MFELKDKLFVNFFCHIVAVVAPINAIIDATTPEIFTTENAFEALGIN